MNPDGFINKLNNKELILFVILLAVLVGIVDYHTGTELSLAIFYLLPVSVAAWYGSWKFSFIIAILSSLLWLNADLSDIDRYSNQAFPLWNAFVRFGFFSIVARLLNNIRKLRDDLEIMVKDRTIDLENEIQERKKIEAELIDNRDKLRQLALRIQNVREEENKVIAREVHDELGQALTALKIEIAWLAKKNSANKELVSGLNPSLSIIDDTIKIVRKISTKLRPRLLDELGFLSAVRYQLKELEQHTDLEVIPVLPEELHIDQNIATAIFRIFQESITNISKHSKATELFVQLEKTNGILIMRVKDNGIGSTPELMNKMNSLGILNMKERAMEIGAKLDIITKQGAGTEVILELNLNNQQ